MVVDLDCSGCVTDIFHSHVNGNPSLLNDIQLCDSKCELWLLVICVKRGSAYEDRTQPLRYKEGEFSEHTFRFKAYLMLRC